MRIQLSNMKEFSNYIQQITQHQCTDQMQLGDYQWFITTLCDSINKHLKVDVRTDTPIGLSVSTVHIKDAIIETSDDFKRGSLFIHFDDSNCNSNMSLSFEDFPLEKVEENTNSQPGSFIKYYIKNDNNQVLAGFVFYYK